MHWRVEIFYLNRHSVLVRPSYQFPGLAWPGLHIMILSNTVWLIYLVAGCLGDEAREKRIQEKARLLIEDEKFEITELPLHSQSERNHSTCPGVTETVSLYR